MAILTKNISQGSGSVVTHLRCGGSLTAFYKLLISLPVKECDKSSAVAEMGDRFATIDMGRKWGGAAVGSWVPLGPRLTQCGLG